jgi:hypothetical protein
MIECIFTIDYEIYGNGEGSLRELVLEPAAQLKTIFDRAGAKFVTFVEVAELRQIDALGTDSAIDDVKQQVVNLHQDGFEIALHLHPQWCNAHYSDCKWQLDYNEYNLCTLPEARIAEIVKESIAYLRKILIDPNFTPLTFRAGNWLFQPTAKIARVLTKHGVKIDSSVFKGGRQHKHKLDYRRARKNGFYWRFDTDVTSPKSTGPLLEIPIYTTMVPFWKMATAKRLNLQKKAAFSARSLKDRLNQLLDLIRLRQPLKFDFCRMTFDELKCMMEQIIRLDRTTPEIFKPLVAIGHTKDCTDFDTIALFLTYLKEMDITISTFEGGCALAKQELSDLTSRYPQNIRSGTAKDCQDRSIAHRSD